MFRGITTGVIIGSFAVAAGVQAQDIDLGTVTQAKEYKTAYGETLKYRIYVSPGLKEGEKVPLVLLLHGAGERGDNNVAQMTHGVKGIISYAQKNNQPLILVAPQCPAGMQWVNVPWGADSHVMPEFPSYPLKLALELCQQIADTMPVDKKRIYITGISMGGYGTWDAIQRKPDYFAAAMPVCGGGDAQFGKALAKLPIWIFHGDKDGVVKTQRSRMMVEAIKNAGGNPNYTECKGVGHDAWNPAYSDQQALAWLFAQKKD